jgi:hypothetical protein
MTADNDAQARKALSEMSWRESEAIRALAAMTAERDAEIERLKAHRCVGVRLAHHRLTTRFQGDGAVFDREFNEMGLPACGDVPAQDVADFDATVANLRARYDLAKTFGDTRHAQLQEAGAALAAMTAERDEAREDARGLRAINHLCNDALTEARAAVAEAQAHDAKMTAERDRAMAMCDRARAEALREAADAVTVDAGERQLAEGTYHRGAVAGLIQARNRLTAMATRHDPRPACAACGDSGPVAGYPDCPACSGTDAKGAM